MNVLCGAAIVFLGACLYGIGVMQGRNEAYEYTYELLSVLLDCAEDEGEPIRGREDENAP